MKKFTKTKWRKVSRSRKCPVCEKPDWCGISDCGKVVRCMRVPSEQESNEGWIHHLEEGVELPKYEPPPKEESNIDWCKRAREMFQHQFAKKKREDLAEQLRVPVWTLEDMLVGIGWDKHNGKEFASFPAYNPKGKVLGITRRYESGAKKTMKGGSNSGIFMKPYWWKIGGPVYVVEGPSDTAACIGKSLCALGRPSNVGGHEYLLTLIKRRAPDRDVIVVGERDEKQPTDDCPDGYHCAGCKSCFPGLYGAKVMAQRLKAVGATWRIPIGPYKDMRDVIASGKLTESLRAVQL